MSFYSQMTHLDSSNREHKSSRTSIIQAVSANAVFCVKIVLELGFDVNAISLPGKIALDIVLEMASHLIIPILLRYQAKPSLKWDVNSEFIQQLNGEDWFPLLLRQIRSTSGGLYVHRCYAYGHAKREDKVMIPESTPDEPYLEVTVPSHFEDVQGIILHVVSHDQGFSDQEAKWGGSYVGSSSWFEVGYKHENARHHICFNVHASSKWHTNRQISDVRNPGKREWLMALKPGDVIQVFAKAKYPGWRNHVRYMKIELFGNESVE